MLIYLLPVSPGRFFAPPRKKNKLSDFIFFCSPRHKILDPKRDFCYNVQKRVEKFAFLYMAAKGVDNHARKDHGLQEHTSAAASGGFSARQTRCRFIARKMFLKHKAE